MRYYFIILLTISLLQSCDRSKKPAVNPKIETARNGTFKITADESFKPLIDSQLSVFLNEYPNIKVVVDYKPEAECFKAFDTDSATRLIITTRNLSAEELAYYKQKFTVGILSEKVANDAIAVILNPTARDSMFTKEDLKQILLGTSKYKYNPVFDGTKETSNLRYMLDSVLRQTDLPKGITGQAGTKAVINYVARNPNAIGFVGVSWIGNDQDAEQLSFMRKVKVAALRCTNCANEVFKKPYQANIATKQYPLVRGLYYIVKNDYGGVATNFAKWMEQERGQLIFKTSYIVPTKMNVFVQITDVEQ